MKKVVLFLTVFGCFILGKANAGSIYGWYYKLGSIVAEIQIKGTGKTSDGDSVSITITPTNIEYVCKNPGGEGHFVEGTPGQYDFTGAEPIDGGNTIQKNGKVTVTVDIDVENQLVLDNSIPPQPIPGGTSKPNPDGECEDGGCVTLYDTLECVNPNWTVLRDSVAVSAMGALAVWFDGDGTPKDSVSAGCTLDPLLRHAEGTSIDEVDVSLLPIPDQIYHCIEDPE